MEKQFAFRSSKDLFAQWLVWMLQRDAENGAKLLGDLRKSEYRIDETIQERDSNFAYSQLVNRALPHLKFLRTDQVQNSIRYESHIAEVDFFDLSGGEKEICYILGQVDRFNLTHGVLLIDEPELHLHAGLVRKWMTFLKQSIDKGQLWTATHSFEAVEVAGAEYTFLLEKGPESSTTFGGSSLADRPIMTALTAALGIPGMSLMGRTLVVVEGGEEFGERQRFEELCGIYSSVQFLPIGRNKKDVMNGTMYYERLADATEGQVAIKGIVDGDFDSPRLGEEPAIDGASLLTLPLHEIENIFLHPPSLLEAARVHGKSNTDIVMLLQQTMDRLAGKWIFDRAKYSRYESWLEAADDEMIQEFRRTVSKCSNSDIPADFEDLHASLSQHPLILQHLREAVAEWSTLRESVDWWKHLLGKEVLRMIAPEVGFRSELSLESYLTNRWSTADGIVPEELLKVKSFVSGAQET